MKVKGFLRVNANHNNDIMTNRRYVWSIVGDSYRDIPVTYDIPEGFTAEDLSTDYRRQAKGAPQGAGRPVVLVIGDQFYKCKAIPVKFDFD